MSDHAKDEEYVTELLARLTAARKIRFMSARVADAAALLRVMVQPWLWRPGRPPAIAPPSSRRPARSWG